MTLAYVKCTHCCARGSNYMDEDRDEAIEDAIEAWNDPNLRQQTFIMKVKKYIRQWMYDLELKADHYCEKFTNRKK